MTCITANDLSIRDFSFDLDSEWLHALWHRTFHARWAISYQAMLDILSGASMLHVAEKNGRRSGFCAGDSQTGHSAGLLLLLVDPALQHRGIGTGLYRLLERKVLERKHRQLNVGAGAGDYFWPGIPAEHDGAWLFFNQLGFQEQEHSEDLVLSLDEFVTPPWVLARQAASGTTLHSADPVRTAELLTFEQEHFPAWLPYFKNELGQGNYRNVLFAQGKDAAISGTLLMRHDTVNPWLKDAGRQTGTLNTLGVAPDRQGQGIGLALTAGAMEQLRQRGCSSCYIQWTGLTEWYGKLGAKPWASYRMAAKTL